jgi:hypothetical protein
VRSARALPATPPAWEHPEVPIEKLADWIVDLLTPGLRRFV